jgi:hypothetical protein
MDTLLALVIGLAVAFGFAGGYALRSLKSIRKRRRARYLT